jgi:hypothetical protein
MKAGIRWTISDQAVLSRSVAGSAPAAGGVDPQTAPGYLYMPYLMSREEGELAIVFRDHTLSDLIGFGYQSWDSRDAANDLLGRIRAIGASSDGRRAGRMSPPLVTIALDGENAWEYYPHDGRDFLHYLYDGLTRDAGLRCVTVSEHLQEYPATTALDWLHTGSWIGGDLRTWSGDPGHNGAWDLLHDARDLAAARRRVAGSRAGIAFAGASTAEPATGTDTHPAAANGADDDVTPNEPASAMNDLPAGPIGDRPGGPMGDPTAEAAWHHVMVAEGSDWFWWFGEHHHTELDYVWDLEFRQHLQEVYRSLGEPVPVRLYLPVFAVAAVIRPTLPTATIRPVIDGRFTDEDGWEKAGLLPPDHPSTMQRADGARLVEARFGWGPDHLYLLLIPRDRADLERLEIDLTVTPAAPEQESAFHFGLAEGGKVEVSCIRRGHLAGNAEAAWRDVVEIAVPLAVPALAADERLALVLHVGKGGMIDQVFRSAGLSPVGET